MIPKFNDDRTKYVKFIQDNQDILTPLLQKEAEELEVEGERFKHPHNQKQKLADINAFSGKKKKFKHVKTTFHYFVDMNLRDGPVKYELLEGLDDDKIHDDGHMENPERRRQIKEFEKWLNTEDVKKVLIKNKLKNYIGKDHIARLKENLAILSVSPMGERDPGGLTYQKVLGEWEQRTMATHDNNMATHDNKEAGKLGGKKRIHQDKLKKTKKKGQKYRKTRRLKMG